MITRRLAVLAVPLTALALAACSSSTSGQGTVAGPGGSSGGSSSGAASRAASAGASSGAASSGVNTSETLASRLQTGVLGIRSAHFTLHVTTGGQAIDGSGDEQLSDGKVVALDLTETVPGAGNLRIVQTGGRTFVQLPGSLNTSGKPWVLVSPGSSNPTVRTLATSLDSTQSSASLNTAAIYATAASSVQDLGATTVAGAPATHYRVVVAVDKLPGNYPGKEQLQTAGITTLPVELFIDGQNRPVQVTDTLTVQGTTVSSLFTVSRYNEPVTITAPPASQVSTG